MTQHRWLVVVLSIGSVPPAWADDRSDPASIVQPARFERAPVIDGRLDDDVWSGAARITRFVQVQPGDNLEPSQATEVLIGYDRTALYLAFRAADTSGTIRATVARRDAIADDDAVGVYLDTFQDRRRAYYVFFNPYGVQADGIYSEGQAAPDLTVDLVIESKGTVDRDGYTVEAAIPFASLRYKAGDAAAWGLHIQRFIRGRDEQMSWMPMSRNRSSLLDQAGQLGGFRDVGVGRPLEIIPSGVAHQIGTPVLRRATPEVEPGVTINFGITPTMTAAFTINPDFAQVETDQLVLTVNQRFPIFYDEKRPFFLEGIDAFQTPINIVHTRTIVAPDQAVKLTGKQGQTTAGVLFATDAGKKSAIRLKRDVGRESTVGVAMTDIHDGAFFSTLVSADARLRATDQTVLTAQVAGSFADWQFRDRERGGRTTRRGNGLAYYAKVERRGRHALFAVTGSGLSPDYRADLGFVRRVNTNAISVQTTYTSEPRADARMISWSATNISHVQWDWQGRSTLVYVYPQLHVNFRRQAYVKAFGFRDYERLFEEEFGVRRAPGRAGAFAGDGKRSTTWEAMSYRLGQRRVNRWRSRRRSRAVGTSSTTISAPDRSFRASVRPRSRIQTRLSIPVRRRHTASAAT
jgi:hypothetical protein